MATYPADYVFNGAVVWYSANLTAAADAKPYLQQIVQNSSSAYQVASIDVSSSESGVYGAAEFNVTANLKSRMDRNSINDIKANVDDALRGAGAQIRASAVRFISNPRRDGQVQGGTIPGGVPKDTYHDNDTVIGNAAGFWLDQIGQQVRGLGTALTQGGSMMWLGIGVVILLVFGNRK